MIKKTLTYKNWDDEEVTEDFWFNLSEADIIEIELSNKKGYSELLKTAQENDDPTIVMDAFRKIVIGAVGRREGQRFIKDEEARGALRDTNAFSTLIVWMFQNPTEAALFINGMLPREAQEKISKDELVAQMKTKTEAMALPVTVNEEPAPIEEPVPALDEVPTMTTETPDFSAMTPEQFEAWKNARP